MTLEEIIKLKTDRLSDIPDELLSSIEKVQKQLLPEVLRLISSLEKTEDGFIILNQANLSIASGIRDQLRALLQESEYAEAVEEFADQFEIQSGVTNELVRKTFPDYLPDPLRAEIVAISKRNAKDLLLDSIGDEWFSDAIAESVEIAIANNASFTDTFRDITNLVVGDGEQEGKLKHYAQQIAHDSFAISDRSYTSSVSEQLDAEWFFYSGSRIKTTRPFCGERHNQYFHYLEIEAWGRGDRTEGMAWPQNGEWAGEMEGTNEKTIYSLAGGNNCRHSIIPVSIFRVPISVVKRAMEQGFFEPSEFEREELGL